MSSSLLRLLTWSLLVVASYFKIKVALSQPSHETAHGHDGMKEETDEGSNWCINFDWFVMLHLHVLY
jgi:hypothetical protein